MKTSYKGRAFIAREEGCVLQAYRDSVGVLTIGIGHTSMAGPPTVTSGLTLTLNECFALFAKDLTKYETRVNAAIKVPVPQQVYDAAVSFDYNTGAINKASWVDSLNEGAAMDVAERFLRWNKPPEIINRRKRELRLLQTGDYGNVVTIPVWEKRGGHVKTMTLPPNTLDVIPPPDVPAPPVTHDEPDIFPAPTENWFVTFLKQLFAAFGKKG